MHILVVYAHPCPESFTAAVRDTVTTALQAAGHTVTVLDLYAMGFNPVMGADERRGYHDAGANEAPVADHLAHLRACDGLIFVHPTWWYGPPAMLKGWVDRVWVPHATFKMPEKGQPIRPVLTNIRLLAVVSTLGSPFWWWRFVMGEPGRRMLLRGLRPLIARKAETFWLGLHEMDSATDADRAAFLAKVRARVARIR